MKADRGVHDLVHGLKIFPLTFIYMGMGYGHLPTPIRPLNERHQCIP